MGYSYEKVQGSQGLSVRTIIHSVDGYKVHWHNEIEIILVLEGSIKVKIEEETYYLKENDLILINSKESHSTIRTSDKNVLLAVQINPDFYSEFLPSFNKIKFDCKSFECIIEKKEVFNVIRHYIAKIVWKLNKKDLGYEFKIGSYLYLLGEHLLNNCKYELIDEEDAKIKDTDLARLQRIMNYVNKNFHKKITLKEIAEKEHLNYYYLSHFIKDKMGMSFQELLNSIRLDNAIKMLMTSDMLVIDISNESGFSNVSSFNNLFKSTYNITPTEMRKEREYKVENKTSKSYLDVDRDSALEKLFQYLKVGKLQVSEDIVSKEDIRLVNIDSKKEGKKFKKYWENLMTFGRAHEGLRTNLQKQFKIIQEEIGFNYVRFHGIFMDEMMICNGSLNGEIRYNWTYVDELFDFFKRHNVKPFLELSFMPDEFKSSDETVFWWKGNISPPKDIKLWIDLVENLIRHCINRYGIEEVKTWYFEVWNEPEFEYLFWAGNREEYFQFYKETAIAIKEISKDLKVGGPSTSHGTILGSSWLDEFLIYCTDGKVPLDFLSIHVFPEYIPKDSVDEARKLLEDSVYIGKSDFKLKQIYHKDKHLLNTINIVDKKIETILKDKIEVHITEWNASSQNGNLIHDTSYVATYIVKDILENIYKVDSLGYWTFTDIMEENKLGISHFSGGFGLINKDGLKKSSYNAYYLLSKLGTKIIDRGEDYIITKDGDNIQILAYNHAEFDDLFISGDTSHISHEERYLIYKTKAKNHIKFNISNIVGDYKIIRYKLNRQNGSTFDEWLRMGSPENMSKEEIKYLQGKEKAKIMVEYLKLTNRYQYEFSIPVHGVEMMILEKQY